MRAIRRVLLGVPLLAILVVVAVFGVRWGLASLDGWRASQILTELNTTAGTSTERQDLLQRGFVYLADAERQAGASPDIHDQRGQLHYWAAMNVAQAGRERAQLLDDAAGEYRASLALRPMWPYTWANLVVAKAERGIFDAEFRRAVRRTVETGPWEPRVQLQLIRVDFVEQQRLDRRSRDYIELMLRRAVQTQPDRVARLAAQYGQAERVCSLLVSVDTVPACNRR